ncbi:MAG: hypothetical protein Q4C54_02240 [Clostridia bacterium]|nr:hypothetical protein [Clostridia bacterium]
MLLAGGDIMSNTVFDTVYAALLGGDNPEQATADFLNGQDTAGAMAGAITMLDTLYQGDYIHPDSAELADDYGAAILRFFKGDIAFMPYNTSKYSGTKKREAKSPEFTEKPFAYSLIPFPGEKGYAVTQRQLGAVYMMMYDGIAPEKKPYVLAFLQLLLGDEGSATLAQMKNMPTANKNVGLDSFPAFKAVDADHRYTVGMTAKGDTLLRLNQMVHAAAVQYAPGITAGELMTATLDALGKD